MPQHRLYILFSAIVASLLAPSMASAGGWVQPKDGYYLKLSGNYLYSTDEFDFEGNKRSLFLTDSTWVDAAYRDVGFTAYLEYGITDRLTLVGSLPFKILTSRRTVQQPFTPVREQDINTGGLGDMSIGIRYPLVDPGVPLAVETKVKIPMGYATEPDNQGSPLGSGKVDASIAMQAGASLYPIPAYLTGDIGYRLRAGSLADEWFFAAEVGGHRGRVFGKVSVAGSLTTTTPADLSQAGTNSGQTFADQDAFKLSPAVGLALSPEVSLVVEAFYIFAGKNTIAGTTMGMGLVFRQ